MYCYYFSYTKPFQKNHVSIYNAFCSIKPNPMLLILQNCQEILPSSNLALSIVTENGARPILMVSTWTHYT